MSEIINRIEAEFTREFDEEIAIGDTVDVGVKIREGEKERVQVFSGTLIRMKGRGTNRVFTVRRIVQGEGVERVFPYNSPRIVSLKVKRRGDVRRAKLYYLRDRVGKGTRVKEKIWSKEQAEREKAKRAKRAEKQAAKAAAKASPPPAPTPDVPEETAEAAAAE